MGKANGIQSDAFKEVAGVTKADQKRFPVEKVSWEDAQRFLGLLNDKEKESGWDVSPAEGGGMGICLPWRAACRQIAERLRFLSGQANESVASAAGQHGGW